MTKNTPDIRQETNHNNSDEIDLFELFESVWQQKILVIIVTALTSLIALGYAFTSTPVYQVQSLVKLAEIKDLDELNGTGIYEIDPKSALMQVARNFESYQVRFDFFKANQAMFKPVINPEQSLEQNFEKFNKSALKTLSPDPKNTTSSSFSGLQLQYPKQLDGPRIINDFIDYAIKVEKDRIEESFEVIVNNRLERLNRRINSLRAGYDADKEAKIAQLKEEDDLKKAQLNDELTALIQQLKSLRENRIQELDEAISIAKTLGITKPATPSSMANETSTASTGSVIRTEVNSQQIPLYFMGTETLTAERKALQARKSDTFTSDRIVEINKALKLLENNRKIEQLQVRENNDLFLKELAENRIEIAHLQDLNVDMEKLHLVRIDQAAIEPSSPIKPNKKLILAVGILLGGMLGLFLALIRSAILKRKQTAQ